MGILYTLKPNDLWCLLFSKQSWLFENSKYLGQQKNQKCKALTSENSKRWKLWDFTKKYGK